MTLEADGRKTTGTSGCDCLKCALCRRFASPSALTPPQVNKGRSVLRPEICRARTFGEQGSSAGQFFNEFLSRIELSSRAVQWSGVDVGYLRCATVRDTERAVLPTLRSQEGRLRRCFLCQGPSIAAGAQRAGGGGAVQR